MFSWHQLTPKKNVEQRLTSNIFSHLLTTKTASKWLAHINRICLEVRACDAKGQAPEQHILKPCLSSFRGSSLEITLNTVYSTSRIDQTYKSMIIYGSRYEYPWSHDVTYISKNPPGQLMPHFRCTVGHLHSMEFWWLCQFQCLLFRADAGK